MKHKGWQSSLESGAQKWCAGLAIAFPRGAQGSSVFSSETLTSCPSDYTADTLRSGFLTLPHRQHSCGKRVSLLGERRRGTDNLRRHLPALSADLAGNSEGESVLFPDRGFKVSYHFASLIF